MNRLSTRKGDPHGRKGKPKAYEVRVQLSCGVHPKGPSENDVQGGATELGGGVPAVRGATEKPDRGRAEDAGPRAHDGLESTEVCGLARDAVQSGGAGLG